jgi:hypothetical protein
LWATWQDTYEDFRKKAIEKEMPVRCISWMKCWIKVLGVKRGKFDQYKCRVCYFGKLAEARVREGRPQPGGEKLIDMYKTCNRPGAF